MIFIGLGSSIGDAESNFRVAEMLLRESGIRVLQKSSVLKNPPLGDIAKNEFSNAVWELSVPQVIAPYDLLLILKDIEKAAGRDMAAPRWADRVLDLDILIFNDRIINMPELQIPHPGIAERDFVLKPLAELVDESFEIPTLGTLTSLLKK